MTEKYSLLPINPQQLTPVQTALQQQQPLSHWCQLKCHYWSLENTFLDIDKIVKGTETQVIHRLELMIQAQDLLKAYQTSMYF